MEFSFLTQSINYISSAYWFVIGFTIPLGLFV